MKINIRPGVSVLQVLRNLNYRPWFALSEFVDNAVQSYIKHRDELETIHGEEYKLKVYIEIDSTAVPARISIRDNAAGIFENEYARAFRTAAIPDDISGLAEFGMGMKSAACWFSPRWSVRTSAIGETVSRTVKFDIENIVHDEIEELTIQENKEIAETHFTEIVLEDVLRLPVGRTLGKIKEHLTDIYRDFVRKNILDLIFNGETLTYQDPEVLTAPYYKENDGKEVLWRKNIEFDFGIGLSVHGFAAIRKTASTSRAGFSLFRRGRVVQGSGDEGYRPELIFGHSNSYRFQRLFGELHLEGFQVSHTKDGFKWDENEQPFLELLREFLDDGELPLLKQADGHRVREPSRRMVSNAKKALANTVQIMETQLPQILPVIAEKESSTEIVKTKLTKISLVESKEFRINFRDTDWIINIELSEDPSESRWVKLSDIAKTYESPRRISIQVSMVHPFMIRFAEMNEESIEGYIRLAVATALSEVLTRDSGVLYAGTFNRYLNALLREALSST